MAPPLWLRLLPRWLREEHGAEIAELHRTRVERADGISARWGVRFRTTIDVTRTAWALRNAGGGRLEQGRGRRGRTTMMDSLIHDIRQSVRHLLRAPGFTLGAVGLLAVGIGANATVFSVVDALLFRPLPWGDADRIVYVYQDDDDGDPSSNSFPAYRDMASSDVFEAVAATVPWSATWDTDDGPVDASVEFATASFPAAMGVTPSRGRWFDPEHDQVGSAYAAVVSWPTWVSRFGADPDVIGRTVRLNDQPVTIIGVGPRDLSGGFPPFVTDFWLSISTTPVGGDFMVANLDRRQDHWYDVRARLAPGIETDQASAAMDALAVRLAEQFPALNTGREITVFEADDIRTHPSQDGGLFAAGSLMTAVVGLVLLLACANLANLLLARGLGRTGEMAVRRALGAGGARVARLFVIEALVLALAGGLLGLALTAWAVRVLPTLELPDVLPGMLDFGVDARVIGFSIGLALVTGVLFGLAPALRAAREDVAGTLRDDGRGISAGRSTRRLRNALVAAQVGASFVLALSTGLVVRGLQVAGQADTGVDVDRVAWTRVDLASATESGAERHAFTQALGDRIGGLPGITSVALTSRLPAQFGGSTTTIVEDYTPSTGTDAVELDFLIVSDAYFETVGIELIAGRTFSEDDALGAPTAVIVNETAARRFWGDRDPIGRRMRGQGNENWRQVVGVVEDAPVSTLAEDVPPAFYFSDRQTGGIENPFIVVRSDRDPAALLSPVREAVTDLRGSITVESQGTMTGHFGDSLAAPRLAATALGLFSLLAASLAGLGVYAVVSFGVARRSTELGIRMALGAGRDRVVGMVVRDVAGTVLIGVLIGTGIAAVLAPRLSAMIYGVDGVDPIAFAAGLLFIVGVSLLAAWLPARRASHTDPAQALRIS